jgi:hypothetical protein
VSQINTYSPDGVERVCTQADRDGGQVMLGVQHGVVQPTRAVDEKADPPVFDELGGAWMPLDRSGVNNLIRALREMRDRAFGRDE